MCPMQPINHRPRPYLHYRLTPAVSSKRGSYAQYGQPRAELLPREARPALWPLHLDQAATMAVGVMRRLRDSDRRFLSQNHRSWRNGVGVLVIVIGRGKMVDLMM